VPLIGNMWLLYAHFSATPLSHDWLILFMGVCTRLHLIVRMAPVDSIAGN
jgi:hypothetical protein